VTREPEALTELPLGFSQSFEIEPDAVYSPAVRTLREGGVVRQ